VTDSGLKELAGLKDLQVLTVSAETTDAGLKELTGLEAIAETGTFVLQRDRHGPARIG
jgi:hypothetical protein